MRRKLRLITGKMVRKTYGKVTIFLCDDTIHPFNLSEWDMYRDDECIEMKKINKQSIEIFFINNVIRVVFEKTMTGEVIPLKPVA